MTAATRWFATALACAALMWAAPAGAQGRSARQQAREPGAEDQPRVSPAEIQRMFDSYALMQAQEQLKISDEQFPQFLSRFKTLQEVRRRALAERARLTQELRRLVNDPQGDEGQMRDRVKALHDLEDRTAVEVRNAYDSLDQVLDVRQQAKFRIFEEMMERRKLELVTRARQANRLKNQQ